MRIAQLAPLQERVPPPRYGGTELVVSVLTEELVRRGHEVTLFASGDSITSARLRAIWPHGLRTSTDVANSQPYEWVHVAAALEAAEEFDIVHNHQGELAMAVSNLVSTPMLTTVHNPVTKDLRIVWDRYDGFYNTVSKSAKKGMPDKNYVGPIYNSIDVASYPYVEAKDDYLLFVGRMSRDKGPHFAIEVARKLGKKLIMAAKVGVEDVRHFNLVVKPMIDGRQIQYLGEADAEAKRMLYARASCLLFPITWNEPFGLVLVEAMACGTPVIAFRHGAAPEIVADGKTGYLVDDADEMARAVMKINKIDPSVCRAHVECKFDAPRLADDYLLAYQLVLERSPRTRRVATDLRRWGQLR
ncbi:MAG: glycosyltransferase family 4 protein [Chloroflexi bacterium]|nr:glycosyltransferase family 4 protein [Chloroflexota bacterium]MDA8187124.1 glycosyltransferase family 4 protein [Dehalococcoidales bacterium]